MKTLYLDENTKDLEIGSNKNWRLTNNLTEYVSQKIESILGFFSEEWFLDYTLGIPYFQSILKKNPDINLINTIFLNAIKNIDEVKEVLKFEITYNESERTYAIDWEVLAIDDTIIENTYEV